MPGGTDEPIWPSQRHRANQRLVAAHHDGGTCEYCRLGQGCAALERAIRELSETSATNRCPHPSAAGPRLRRRRTL